MYMYMETGPDSWGADFFARVTHGIQRPITMIITYFSKFEM